MENLETLFDLIDHPEKYTQEEIETIMADPENRRAYNLICKTESAVKADKADEIEEEWKRFSERHVGCGVTVIKRRRFLMPGNRAASIAVIVFVSIAAVAAGIGISAVLKDKEPDMVNQIEADKLNDDTVATILTDTTVEREDSIVGKVEPLVFENESLRVILDKVAELYKAEIVVNNEEAAELKLFFKLDPALPLKDVIERFNTFEQINVSLKEDTITVN